MADLGYEAKTGSFDITVSIPLNVDSVPIQQVQTETQFNMTPMNTFEGKSYIPALPKVTFAVSMLYIDTVPSQQLVTDEDPTDETYEGKANRIGEIVQDLSIGGNTFDAALNGVKIDAAPIGEEGVMGLAFSPSFTYVGKRG